MTLAKARKCWVTMQARGSLTSWAPSSRSDINATSGHSASADDASSLRPNNPEDFRTDTLGLVGPDPGREDTHREDPD